MPKILSLKPMISEKAYALSQDRNTYVFGVGKAANCQQVAEAVATQFKVTVAAVRLSSTPGKKQSIISRGRRLNRVGQRPGIRKAYVTLKAGDKLPFFAAVEEAAEKEKAAEAKAKNKEAKE